MPHELIQPEDSRAAEWLRHPERRVPCPKTDNAFRPPAWCGENRKKLKAYPEGIGERCRYFEGLVELDRGHRKCLRLVCSHPRVVRDAMFEMED